VQCAVVNTCVRYCSTTPTTITTTTTATTQLSGGGGLKAQIAAGKKLRAEREAKEAAAKPAGGMSMMDEIKMKKKLKSAASRGVKEPAKPAASTGPMSMMDEIKMKRKLKSVKDRAPKVSISLQITIL
jgi:hypothetical protein